MYTAWMIRNDSKIFPCIQHFYANENDVEETLYAAEWLYNSTRFPETKTLVLQIVAVWLQTIIVTGDSLQDAQDYISQRPYLFLSSKFLTIHYSKIICIPTKNLSLRELCQEIATALNQEFLRARFGGMYHTIQKCDEIFFRISSVGYDWYSIIHEFLKTSTGLEIRTISIVRDEESTGVKEAFYCKHMSLEEFARQDITLTVPQECGNKMNNYIHTQLSKGKSLRYLQNLQIDADSLNLNLKRLTCMENNYALGKIQKYDEYVIN